MNTFKNGDIVKLKSGGPEMTVTDANPRLSKDLEGTTVLCEWDDNGTIQSSDFHPDSLESV